MQFEITRDNFSLNSKLFYDIDSFSLDCEIDKSELSIFTSILINDLHLEVDDEGKILFIHGLCPHTIWKPTVLIPTTYFKGVLKVSINQDFVPGVSKRLNNCQKWPVFFDQNSGWICLGNKDFKGQGVEFSPSCIAKLDSGMMKSLWLKPDTKSLKNVLAVS